MTWRERLESIRRYYGFIPGVAGGRADAERVKRDVEFLTRIVREYIAVKRNIKAGEDPILGVTKARPGEIEAIRAMIGKLVGAVEVVAPFLPIASDNKGGEPHDAAPENN